MASETDQPETRSGTGAAPETPTATDGLTPGSRDLFGVTVRAPVQDGLPAGEGPPELDLEAPPFPETAFRRVDDQGDRLRSIPESLLICGDAQHALRMLPDESVQTVVTSPPYWSLRDYRVPEQTGRDEALETYVGRIVDALDELRRVLRPDGTVWLNVGDSYTSGNRRYRAPDRKNRARAMHVRPSTPAGLKPKDLIGVPWRLAFALQETGWWLRSEVIWHKPNAHPESVGDRPTKAHETIFLLSKEQNYHYDIDALRGPNGRRLRDVWEIATEPLKRGESVPDDHPANFAPVP